MTVEEYTKALFDNTKITGTNKGFKMHDGKMSTCEQNTTILINEYS